MNYNQANEKYDYGNSYSVYVHIFPDGKLYIGSTRQKPESRWRYGGGYKNSKTVYEPIQKYGWESIKHIVLFSNIDFDRAMIIEQELIKKYDTRNPEKGYNTKGGGQFYTEHSEEFINNMRNRMKGNTYCVGRKLRPEHIEALRKSNTGKHRPSPYKGKHIHTEERKKMFSEMAKERWKNPEYREAHRLHHPDMSGKNNPRYGAIVSEETRRKISKANKGRKQNLTDEQRKKRSEKASRKVYKCDKNETILCLYDSLKKAAEDVGVPSTNIGFCCRNKHRTAGGFKWRYADEIDRGFPESNGKA